MTVWKKRLSLILAVTMVFSLCILSAANADTDRVSENVQAYRGVRVQYNGQLLTAEQQPYIINNVTYVPLRLLMNNFGKDISYDNAANKVVIKDKISADAATIANLKEKIAKLEKENSTLKTENASLTTKNTSLANRIAALEDDDYELTNMEDELMDDYEDAGDDYFNDYDIEVDITVDGDEDDIEFEIFLDFSDSNRFDDLTDVSTTNFKSLMKAVYSDVEQLIEDTDYEDADITGYIIDDNDYEVSYNGSTFDNNFDE